MLKYVENVAHETLQHQLNAENAAAKTSAGKREK